MGTIIQKDAKYIFLDFCLEPKKLLISFFDCFLAENKLRMLIELCMVKNKEIIGIKLKYINFMNCKILFDERDI